MSTYSDLVKSTFGTSLLAYWIFGEASGTTADNEEGTAARNGIYMGVDLGQEGMGDGNTAVYFIDSGDKINIYSTSLRDVFSGTEGTFSIWLKIGPDGWEADGHARSIFNFTADSGNYIELYKHSTNDNYLFLGYKANSVWSETAIDYINATRWTHFAVTWSLSRGSVKIYIDGWQQGDDRELTETWAGLLSANTCVIGNYSTVGTTQNWTGWLAHAALGNAALTDGQIQLLASTNYSGPPTPPTPPEMIDDAYTVIVKAMEPANLLAYWPMSEPNGNIAYDVSGNSRNGAYKNISLGEAGMGSGNSSAYFYDTGDALNVYSTSLGAAFNGQEGALLVWFRVDSLAVWTDGVRRRIAQFGVNSSNLIEIYKYNGTTSTAVFVAYRANGITKTAHVSYVKPVGWVCLVFTWSLSNDRIRTYLNGVQQFYDGTGLGTWTGNLSSNQAVIGNYSPIGSNNWRGYLSNAAIWDKELTPAQCRTLAYSKYYGFGGVLLTFDDGDESIYLGFQYMQARNARGTVYIVPNLIGTSGYFTVGQLLELQNAGWSVANHTIDHTALDSLDAEAQEIKIRDGIEALEGMGIGGSRYHMAYPYGGYNAGSFIALANTGTKTARRAAGGVLDTPTIDPDLVDPYLVGIVYSVSSTVTLEDIQGIISESVSRGQYVGLLIHRLTAGVPSSSIWSYANFYALIDWLVAQEIPIKTIEDYYLASSGSPEESNVIDVITPKETHHDYCPCSPDAWMWCTNAYLKMIKARYPVPY